MFKKPGTYDVIMRYSSLLPLLVPDSAPAPRGIGMKIFGVEGEKIWGEDKKTQDWTFNNYPVLELRTPKDTWEHADALERNFDNIPKFQEEAAARPDAELATLPGKLPRQHRKLVTEGSCRPFKADEGIFSGRHARVLSIRLSPW